MALKQSRRTVSMTRDLFERAKERAAKDGMPLAAWVARLVTVELDDQAAVEARRNERLPEPVDATFCALCTSERGPFVLRPLGKAGANVAVCPSCDSVHPRSGRISFVESSKAPAKPSHSKGGVAG
jgi:hypothetical protein